jgi:hypothetical protein
MVMLKKKNFWTKVRIKNTSTRIDRFSKRKVCCYFLLSFGKDHFVSIPFEIIRKKHLEPKNRKVEKWMNKVGDSSC